MKQIKGFLFVLTGLSVMITLVSLLMPSKVMTARSVIIHADATTIFPAVTDLAKWKNWHPVFMQDSVNIMISNPSSGLNAFAEWSSANLRNKLLVTDVNANAVKLSLAREGERDIENIISMYPVNDSNGIQVEWRVLNTLKWYPWEKFYGIFIDKITGPGYEMALNSLKEYAENTRP